jgi:hypothetical protein
MRESVKKFAEEMNQRLNEYDADREVTVSNEHSLTYFLSKLIDEVEEFRESAGSGDFTVGKKVAVDIANSSRAIFDICDKLLDDKVSLGERH